MENLLSIANKANVCSFVCVWFCADQLKCANLLLLMMVLAAIVVAIKLCCCAADPAVYIDRDTIFASICLCANIILCTHSIHP